MAYIAKGLALKWTRTGIGFVLLALVCFLGLSIFKKITGPTYQDHNMEWWLDYANDDGRGYYALQGSGDQSSPRQKESIEAFRTFGDPGVEFLCTEVYKAGRTNVIASTVQKVINWIPWSKRRDFHREAINKSGTASYLLSTMGISYEQAEMLAQPKLQSPNPDTRNSIIWIYHMVTNRLDLVAQKTVPFLTHTNALQRFWAVKTMKNFTPEEARICYLALIDPIHLLSAREEYFQVLAKFASDSPEIKKHLLGLTGSPEPRISILIHLALVHGFPEEPSYKEKLIELVKSDVESSLTSCLGTLRNWPYPITLLHPVLIELVQTSKKPDEYLQIIELLRLGDVDLAPVIPQLHSLLYFSPFENEYGFYSVRSRDITAMALLLAHNLEDKKVWAYLEDLFGQMLPPIADKKDKQSKGTISMARDRAVFLQRLAQYHKKAEKVLNNLPLARIKLEDHEFMWIDSLLRKHHLIPLETMDDKP